MMCDGLRISLVALLFASLLSGCSVLPERDKKEFRSAEVATPPPVQANGAIYQPSVAYTPFFEDLRPRQVGDILTIVLREEVSASKNSSSNISRSGSASLAPDQLPDGLDSLGKYAFDLSGESDFSGGGGSEANNTLTGTITVTVAEVYPNGNLRVTGEKQIAINQGKEFVRFSGVVNPRNVDGQNSVLSTQVADAHIEYVGEGYINEAQRMGWLQRFFLLVAPF